MRAIINLGPAAFDKYKRKVAVTTSRRTDSIFRIAFMLAGSGYPAL
jgi:hypothetical protein